MFRYFARRRRLDAQAAEQVNQITALCLAIQNLEQTINELTKETK